MLLPTMSDPFMYPVYHSLFKDMFAEHFQNMKHELVWIVDSRDKPNKNQVVYWNGIRCHIMMAPFQNRNAFTKFANAFFIYLDKYLTMNKITKNEKIDIIQVRNSVIDGLLALHFKKRNNSTIVFQLSYPVAEGMIRYPHFKYEKFSFLAYIYGKVDKILINWTLLKSDIILPISKWMKMDLESEGIPGDKMYPLPLGCNPDKGKNGHLIRRKFNLDGYNTLIYVGNMDKIRNLDFLIDVFVIVENRIKNYKLLMVGNGNDKERLQEIVKKRGLDEKIIFTGFIDRNLIPDYIAAADIGLSPIVPLPIYEISSPTKPIEYMGEGKPVVANDIPDQKEILKDSGGGICTSYDVNEFAEAIIKIIEEKNIAKKMGELGRKYVYKCRDYALLAKNLERKYINVCIQKEIDGD